MNMPACEFAIPMKDDAIECDENSLRETGAVVQRWFQVL